MQYLADTSAATLKQALTETASTSPAAQAFEFRVRLACSDRLAANFAAERGIASDRGDSWACLSHGCDIHDLATAQTKTWEFFKGDITGMVNLSLSLRLQGCMRNSGLL